MQGIEPHIIERMCVCAVCVVAASWAGGMSVVVREQNV